MSAIDSSTVSFYSNFSPRYVYTKEELLAIRVNMTVNNKFQNSLNLNDPIIVYLFQIKKTQD